MATSQRKPQRRSSKSNSSSAELHASRFPFKDIDAEWMMNAVSYRCGSVKLWLAATRDGSFGKTSHTLLSSTEEKRLPQSFEGWMNSGISAHGECWTLNTSESPSDGAACSLSQVIDRGDTLGRSYLSREQMQKMLARLEKYKQENCLTDALRMALSDGAETKRRSVDET